MPEAFEERALPGTPGQLLLLGKLTHAMVQLTVIRSPGQRADYVTLFAIGSSILAHVRFFGAVGPREYGRFCVSHPLKCTG